MACRCAMGDIFLLRDTGSGQQVEKLYSRRGKEMGERRGVRILEILASMRLCFQFRLLQYLLWTTTHHQSQFLTLGYYKMLVFIILTILTPNPIYSLHLQPQPKTPSPSIFSLYHNNTGLDQQALSLSTQYPSICETRKCQQANIQYLHIGDQSVSNVVIVCNIHARQAITGEVCMHWAQQFLSNSTGDQASLKGLGIDLFYLPNVNRDKTILGNQCVRSSPKGYDMNRNFPTEFRFYKTNPGGQIYSGQQPISDDFTQCLSRLLTKQKPLMFVDLHSGQNGGLFYQQGYNSRQDRQIFQLLNTKICANNCRITTLARDGQAINGHIFADVKVRLKVKYSLLLEIYGNQDRDCLKEFNPYTREDFDATVEKWSKALDLIIGELRKRENL